MVKYLCFVYFRFELLHNYANQKYGQRSQQCYAEMCGYCGQIFGGRLLAILFYYFQEAERQQCEHNSNT